MSATSASAHGLQTVDVASGTVLEAFFPAPALGREPTPVDLPAEAREDALRGVRVEPVTVAL
ncbi:MAG TPA: hypothetical protein VIL49_04600, partial [Capillimicrobium sp.]